MRDYHKAYGLEEKMDSRMDQALAERRRQEEASAVLVGLIAKRIGKVLERWDLEKE